LALHVPQLPENKSFLLLFWKKEALPLRKKRPAPQGSGPFYCAAHPSDCQVRQKNVSIIL
jgi:hypothetical protein